MDLISNTLNILAIIIGLAGLGYGIYTLRKKKQ